MKFDVKNIVNGAVNGIKKIPDMQIFVKGNGEISLLDKTCPCHPKAKIEIDEEGKAVDVKVILAVAGALIAVKTVFSLIDELF